MSTTIYLDISMKDDDIWKDGNEQVGTLTDRDVIAQDVIHMIRESGLLVGMIGERSAEMRQLATIDIILLVETDTRIVPGTVIFNTEKVTGRYGRWALRAQTFEFGDFAATITAGVPDDD